MPEPITTFVAGIGLAYAVARQQNSVSAEAGVLRERARDVRSAYEGSQALFGPQSALLAQLRHLATECQNANWDGYDAEPVTNEALALAASFLRALPSGFPLPDLCVEPDGSVAMEWHFGRYKRFSASFGKTNRLALAWLDGLDTGHAVAQFDGASIPSLVRSRVMEIAGDAPAAFRAA